MWFSKENSIFKCKKFNNEIKYFDFEWIETIISDDEDKAFNACLEYQKLLSYCQASDLAIKPDEVRELIKMKSFL